MKSFERVAVVGLGLMGGSLARALAAREVVVLGHDSLPETIDAAEREGIVRERLDAQLRGLDTADAIVLALPVDATVAIMPLIAARAGSARLIMDVASTKRSIIAAAECAGLGPRYVGAHPLTGSHRSGWRASRVSLFDDARVFLCPTSFTPDHVLADAEAFWRGLRAGVEVLGASTHDEEMAWRSHLPHVLSTALARALHDAGRRRSALGPGGRDMTRLAGGAPELWSAIVDDNREQMMHALDGLERQLQLFRAALLGPDGSSTHEYFAAGRDWFDGEPLEPLDPLTPRGA